MRTLKYVIPTAVIGILIVNKEADDTQNTSH